ncbi:probable NADH dehydrogenase [ubiquinone] 1 alpha subcomplex subunit 12 [Cydia fagiglandana]|uniref:probable NADH dehydrogenase [ubiquinone] 1 alpha subcomplex subunit 12 n=1 Tax=Cydia fagiglandana TaxID=1458189 RepID=UPI002FEE47AD
MSLSEYHQISKLKHFFATVRANGGFKNTLYKLWRFDTFKHGCLMGWDVNGNKYYENQRYMIGRSRWVEYAEHYKWEYDGSQVTPEWFGWLHYMTDQVPCCNLIKCCMRQSDCHNRWLLPPEENMTGTTRQYYPYSTTRQAVAVWDGSSLCELPCPPVCCDSKHS